MRYLIAAALLSFWTSLMAQGSGAVLSQNTEAFEKPDGATMEYRLQAGTYVYFKKGFTRDYQSTNGFVNIGFFEDNDGGNPKFAWVSERAIALFQWPCPGADCSALSVEDGSRVRLLMQFKSVAQDKCKELGIATTNKPIMISNETPPGPQVAATAPDPPLHPVTTTAEVLTNQSVIDSLKAGLSPSIVTMKIQASTCRFDLSTEGLLELQKESVPQEVIKAMLDKGSAN